MLFNYPITLLLKEHGEMDFEEIADIVGSAWDHIELENQIQRLINQGLVNMRFNEDRQVRVFSIA